MKATTTLPSARADDLELCLRASTVDTLQRGGTVFDLTASCTKVGERVCDESAAQASRSADCCTCDVNALRACQAL